MWCPECEEKVDRREVIENDHRCPMCGHNFKEKDDDFEDRTDDFEDDDIDNEY